jgi:hypothetical protein
MMQISATDPVFHAFEQMKRVLFQPFDIAKWFVLGFCAWLSQLGAGGGAGGNYANWGRGKGPGLQGLLLGAQDWISENWFLAGFIIMGVFTVSMLVALVLLWLRSRGTFLFIDGIVHNRGEVIQPWKEYSVEGNRLFVARVVVMVAFLVMMGAVILVAGGIVWSDLAADDQLDDQSFLALLVVILAGVPVFVLFFVIRLLINDFVVPVMYAQRAPFMDAAGAAWQEIIKPYLGNFLLFYLIRFVMAVVLGFIAVVVTLITCCIAALPYIGTVILLPLLLFGRSYSLFYVDQFGPDFKIFPRPQETDDLLPRDTRFVEPEEGGI